MPVLRLARENAHHIWLYMQKKGLLRGYKRMLHVAPMPSLEKKIRKMKNIAYTTMDIKGAVDLRASLTNLPFDPDFFDLIFCSHVLEHIDDDALALSELYRVLNSQGLAILQVPLRGEETFEDPAATTPEERDRVYGQFDHVRCYGRDVRLRFEKAGFRVEECQMPDALGLSDRQIERYNVALRETAHFCHKSLS